MYKTIKVTAISLKPTKWDKPGNADAMERFFRKAAEDGPDLILQTEGVLEGYVIMDVIEGRKTADELVETAEPIDGEYIRRFQDLAKELKTCLAFGFAERIGGEVFNAAIFIDTEGEILGRYHKTQLAEGTDESWIFNRVGSTIRAFDTPFGRAGFVILQRPLESDDREDAGARRRAVHPDSVVRIEIERSERDRSCAGPGERSAHRRSECRREHDRQQGRGRGLCLGKRPDNDCHYRYSCSGVD